MDAFGRADIVEHQDVGVSERGDGSGFLFEPLQRLWIGRHALGQDFDGDLAAEAKIGGAVDVADASLSEE